MVERSELSTPSARPVTTVCIRISTVVVVVAVSAVTAPKCEGHIGSDTTGHRLRSHITRSRAYHRGGIHDRSLWNHHGLNGCALIHNRLNRGGLHVINRLLNDNRSRRAVCGAGLTPSDPKAKRN